jgi:hypothetical protein
LKIRPELGFFTTPAPQLRAARTQPLAVIVSHTNEAATKDGRVNPNTRAQLFTELVKGRPVHVPLSGKTMEFDGSAKCVRSC